MSVAFSVAVSLSSVQYELPFFVDCHCTSRVLTSPSFLCLQDHKQSTTRHTKSSTLQVHTFIYKVCHFIPSTQSNKPHHVPGSHITLTRSVILSLQHDPANPIMLQVHIITLTGLSSCPFNMIKQTPSCYWFTPLPWQVPSSHPFNMIQRIPSFFGCCCC